MIKRIHLKIFLKFKNRGMAGSLTADDAIDIRSDMWKRFTCGSFSKGQGATKIYFKPFDASYSYFKNQEKILPFLTTFIMVQTPTTEPSNWNEYTGKRFFVIKLSLAAILVYMHFFTEKIHFRLKVIVLKDF